MIKCILILCVGGEGWVWGCGGHTIMSMLVVNSLRHGVSGVKYVIIGIRINHLLSRTYTMQILLLSHDKIFEKSAGSSNNQYDPLVLNFHVLTFFNDAVGSPLKLPVFRSKQHIYIYTYILCLFLSFPFEIHAMTMPSTRMVLTVFCSYDMGMKFTILIHIYQMSKAMCITRPLSIHYCTKKLKIE